jgi:hypothetical protein
VLFYTYEYLRDDGSPWYIGKGCGERAYRSHPGHRPPKDRNKIKLRFWPDEATAFAFERYLIDFWGRKDIETGCLWNKTDGGQGVSNPGEAAREAYRANGRRTGKRNVETGFLSSIITFEIRGRGGKVSGRKNVENGHLLSVASQGGKKGGRKNAESGHMSSISSLGRHTHWHVNRGVVNPKCAFCRTPESNA